jgi:hypothetical protein
MPDEKKGSPDPKKQADLLGRIEKLEARVAELNDKLSKFQFTEEEWKAYEKINSALAHAASTCGGAGEGGTPIAIPFLSFGLAKPCVRCSFQLMTACVLTAFQQGEGTKPGVEFDEFGKPK